ncbi:2-oxoglutarate dehydrogenase E2 component (dihydrolipoamide succinyltransferase) [Bacteroides luti]|uniref:Dihydrolipoamide acetyltransferase component of pyruvate dehydrogenase complex n=1 Tax=Bacteroides luti TaxID=1297750 RepID=A0A1M4Y2I7_9BACE|nr:dihydrolipoamide acetyltransferase family protein [Bacteroides luti]SHE99900.1 2-oxoglutarate dehydrogenase E2 component (dihydrolipoamide succinyltransferase) [Bacteroides luti]
MATFEIKMPKLGESITEGTIMTWSVKAGDVINEDDILFEVSTAKVSAEIPSPVAGKILQILFKEGDTVSVGTVVAIVQLEGDSEEETPEVGESTTAKEEAPASSAEPVKNVKSEEARWYSPIVLQIAQEAQLSKEELDSIPGTGYEGRLSKKDIKTYVEQRKKGAQPAALAAPQKTVSAEPALVFPQKVASAEPAFVAPSKPVTVSQPVAAESKPAPTTPVIPVSDGDEVVEMDFVRRIIADHMVMSKQVSPHVTTVVEVDVTKLVRWRERNKESFQRREGISLTYMPAIVEAVTKALAEYPYVNASVDGYRMILKKKINVGVAVSLNDGNLIVPVIHNADKLSLSGLAGSIDTLAAKARANKLSPDDIQGGTFTITNFGTFKNIIGTPIINQPQVAILGVGYIEKKPAVVETPEGDTIAIRHKMYLSLSYDHRIVNGAMGGAFLRRIADYLENWNG